MALRTSERFWMPNLRKFLEINNWSSVPNSAVGANFSPAPEARLTIPIHSLSLSKGHCRKHGDVVYYDGNAYRN